MFCFYLNFFLLFYSYLSASQPQIVTQDRGEQQRKKKKKVFRRIQTFARLTIWGLQCFRDKRITSTRVLRSGWFFVFFFFLFLMVLALCGSVKWTCVPFKLCCFQSLPTGFISQRDISTRQQETSFVFVFFSSPFFFSVWFLVGHKTSQSKVSFDFMLDFFFVVLFAIDYVTLICVCLSDWRRKKKKKKRGGSDYFCDAFQ